MIQIPLKLRNSKFKNISIEDASDLIKYFAKTNSVIEGMEIITEVIDCEKEDGGSTHFWVKDNLELAFAFNRVFEDMQKLLTPEGGW